eukprot:6802993-Heterocapsa_arctica.AAC.1
MATEAGSIGITVRAPSAPTREIASSSHKVRALRARRARSPSSAGHGPGMMYDLYSPSRILSPPGICTGTVETPHDVVGFPSMPCSF